GVGDTVVSQVGLEEEVLLPGKRGARLAAARRREEAAAAERADLERRLAFELRARFVALLEATERLRLARENLEHYRETVRVSEARAREGDISRAEFDKIALEQRGFEREVADAEGDRREAVAALLARREVEKLRLAIPQEVRSAATSYTIARERARRFEEAFLRQAGEARHAAEVSFREGAVSLLEFLEAERTYVQTEREHLAALR